METKKLYYTDGYKAAIMMRDYLVRLQRADGSAVPTLEHAVKMTSLGQEAYIHPESLHIFEPVDGDVDKEGYTYYVCEEYGGYWYQGDDDKDESQTAMRGGEHFFTPEELS